MKSNGKIILLTKIRLRITVCKEQSWKKCRFLGSLLENKEDINRRKQLACVTFNIYKPALCSNKISFKLRIRVFQALISSIFLYNSELWSLSKAQNNKLGVFQRIFLRQIIRNRKISNNEIYKLCNIEPWSNEIKRRRLKWFGHLVRLPENAPAKQALAEARKPYKKISGGQTTTWLSTLKKYYSELNYNLKEAFEIAYDRDIYTQHVCRAVARSHQADWRRKRRLKEEMAGPEACGWRRQETWKQGKRKKILL